MTSPATIEVTLKLYASLGAFLPEGSTRNEARVRIAPGTTIDALLDAHNVPRESRHLVLLNGVFQPPAARPSVMLSERDALAVWPPVAGG